MTIDHSAFAPTLHRDFDARRLSEIQLDPGSRWRGQIDADPTDDLPLAGTICATGRFPLESEAMRPSWQRCAEIAPSGEFQLDGLPPGPIDVEVEAPGWLLFSQTVDPRHEHRLYILRGVSLIGRVTDRQELPIAGAAIRAQGAAPVKTDAGGRFHLEVPRLPAQVEAHANGYRPTHLAVAEEDEVELILEPAGQVLGRLLGDPGEPLSDVEIRFFGFTNSGRQDGRLRLENDDGRFRVELSEPGTYTFRFLARGYREVVQPRVEVGLGQAHNLGALPLSRGAGLRGTTADASNGQTLAGVLVEALPVGPDVIRTQTDRGAVTDVTDSTGAFTLAGLDIGRYHVRWQRDGLATVHRLVDLEEDGLVDVGTLFMDAGVTLVGHLTGRDGMARPGLKLRLLDPATEVWTPWAQADTGAEGQFQLEAIATGRYRVQVVGERLLLAQEIEVVAGQAEQRLDLRVGGVDLHGRLTHRGLPVSGGWVTLTHFLGRILPRRPIERRMGDARLSFGTPGSALAGEVGEDGSFDLVDVPPGIGWLSYTDGVETRMSRSVFVPDRDTVDLRLDLDGVPLEGRVVDAETGAGLSARVALHDLTGLPTSMTETDADGWFRLKDLEPDEYDLVASASGYATGRLHELAISEEGNLQEIELQPSHQGSGRIEASFWRVDGSEVFMAPLVFDAHGAIVRPHPSPTRGPSYEGLSEDDYYVGWADSLAGIGVASRVRVRPGRTTAIEPVLTAGASVVLSCPADRCADAPVDLITVRSSEGPDLTPLLTGLSPALRFSSAGDLSLGRLAPGRYRFRLWVGDRRWEREVSIGTGDVHVSLP